jgi:hypothetical protein
MLLIFWNVSIDVLKKKYKKSKVYNIKKWKLKKMRLYINWRRRNSLVVVLYKRQFHFRSCVCWGSYGGVSSISSNLSLVSCLRIIQILHHRFQKQTSFCSFSLLFIYYFFFHFIFFFSSSILRFKSKVSSCDMLSCWCLYESLFHHRRWFFFYGLIHTVKD